MHIKYTLHIIDLVKPPHDDEGSSGFEDLTLGKTVTNNVVSLIFFSAAVSILIYAEIKLKRPEQYHSDQLNESK